MSVTIPISMIQYKEGEINWDEINKLKDSIQSRGLLHPITVTSSDSGYKLVAGKKRLMAFRKMNTSHIECLVLDDLTKQDVLEIGIDENLRRHNLPWYEEVELEKQLHLMRVAEKGKARNLGQGKGKTGWSLRDTAKELSKSIHIISDDMKLADALEHHPELRHVKDKATATKIMKRLAKQAGAETEAGMPIDFPANEVLLGDSKELLKYYPSNSFDACITDPPWKKFFKDSDLTSDASTPLVFEQLYRVLKYDSFLYIFLGMDDFYDYLNLLPKVGFKVQETPLIWHKTNVISHGRRDWEYGRDTEQILLAVKGNPSLTESRQLSSVMTCPIIHYTKQIHPNEKPISLIEKIIGHCTFFGALIIDPFAGSGAILDACKKQGRRYVGIERDKNYFDLIEGRLRDDSK